MLTTTFRHEFIPRNVQKNAFVIECIGTVTPEPVLRNSIFCIVRPRQGRSQATGTTRTFFLFKTILNPFNNHNNNKHGVHDLISTMIVN